MLLINQIVETFVFLQYLKVEKVLFIFMKRKKECEASFIICMYQRCFLLHKQTQFYK